MPPVALVSLANQTLDNTIGALFLGVLGAALYVQTSTILALVLTTCVVYSGSPRCRRTGTTIHILTIRRFIGSQLAHFGV